MYVEQGRMDEAASHVPIQPENDWSRARSESSIKPTDTSTTSLLIISFTATKFMITSTEEVVEENDAATRCNSRQGTGMRDFSVAAVLLNLLKAITSCIPGSYPSMLSTLSSAYLDRRLLAMLQPLLRLGRLSSVHCAWRLASTSTGLFRLDYLRSTRAYPAVLNALITKRSHL